ncbi:dynamin family protein [Bacillus solitudinis]|uniref:dynamin family protein n=1 Tax=Bacillus solitudinis TaxID=2014074 RepID=UPI000C23FA28|nr:dynamin family protein [Bacillus solitudinis]
MSFSLDVFKQTQTEVVQGFEQLSFLLAEMRLENEKEKVSVLKQQLQEEQFTIVVVGEFSRGKSTFINALLGKRVLPSLVRPTTVVLNKIIYKPEPSIELHYHDDDRMETITEEDFKKLIAPKEPLAGDEASMKEYESEVDKIKRVKHAEIGYPLPFCENGVQIIDTPGTNDLDPVREQITNNIIPTSDAAILLLAATKILSASEISFLRDRLLANDIHKIFIVINFKDEMQSEADVEKVMSYARNKLMPILADVKIFMVSAKEALNHRRIANGEVITFRGEPVQPWPLEKTGYLELEKALADFLQYDRGSVKLRKPIRQAVKLIDHVLKSQIEFEKSSLTNKVEGIQEKVKAYYPKLNEVKKIGMDAEKRIESALKAEALTLVEWYKDELKSISKVAMDVFEENQYEDSNEINYEVEQAIAPLERALHIEKNRRMNETIKSVIEKMSRNLNQEWAELDTTIQNLSGQGTLDVLDLAAVAQVESQRSMFDDLIEELDDAWANSSSFLGKVAIGAGYALTLVASGISWVVGWFIPREDPVAKMKRQLISQLKETRRSKVIAFESQWRGLSKAVIVQFHQIVAQHVEQAEGQLSKLEQNARLATDEVQKKLEIIERREKRLKATKDQLESVYERVAKTRAIEV